MSLGLLQSNIEDRKLLLDPRTKLFMLITMSVFVLGGAGADKMPYVAPILCVMPLVCMFADRRVGSALLYMGLYGGLTLIDMYLLPVVPGSLYYVCYMTVTVFIRFLPSVIMAQYVVASTTVSEFMSAMKKMHISDKITIPMAVMFRLFPTIMEEFLFINSAMKMRDIRLGGRNVGKMVEYRFVPLMTCAVQIGNELSAAALTRGLGGDVKRTNICKIGFGLTDFFMIILCVIPFIGLLLYSIGLLC